GDTRSSGVESVMRHWRRGGRRRTDGGARPLGAGPAGGADAGVPGAHAARARAVARTVAAGARLADHRGGGGLGARPADDWSVAGSVLPGGTGEHLLRAQWGLPPALSTRQQAQLKAAVQAPPRAAGIEAGDGNWKVVRAFCRERFGVTLCRSS